MKKPNELVFFGDKLRDVRKQLKLSQVVFAQSIGISGAHISAIELGKTGVSESFLKLIEAKYQINIDWLKTGEGEMFLPVLKTHSNESIEKALDSFAIQNTPEIGGLTDQEKRIIRMFRKLDPERKQRIIDLVTDAFIAAKE